LFLNNICDKIKKIFNKKYMNINSLDSKVFQDELDFKTLENILESLDHVIPKKISRQEYNNLNGSFLVET
jgi:hypothetical protein